MIIYQLYALIGLAIAHIAFSPLYQLLCVLSYCLGGWFTKPKDTLVTSLLTCIYLMFFGHVPWLTGGLILVSHPVVLLVVGCLIAQVIIKNDIHLVISAYLMNSFKPSTELSIVLLMIYIINRVFTLCMYQLND